MPPIGLPTKTVSGPHLVNDADRGIEIVETYEVLCDRLGEDPAVVENAPGIPTMGQSYGESAPLLVVRRRLARVKNGKLWTVEVGYSAPPSGGELDPNPLTWAPVMTGGGGRPYEEQLDVDLDGRPVMNSARQLFDVPMACTRYDFEFTIEKNYRYVDYNILSLYFGAVNADKFLIFPAGVVKCVNIEFDRPRRASGVTYIPHTFTFRVRRPLPAVEQTLGDNSKMTVGGPINAWKQRRIDAGYEEWYQSDPDTQLPIYRTIRSDDGERIGAPALLDGAGGLRKSDEPPVYLEFRDSEMLPFSVLQIFSV